MKGEANRVSEDLVMVMGSACLLNSRLNTYVLPIVHIIKRRAVDKF